MTPAPSRTLGPSSASSIAMIVLMVGVILCRTNEFKHAMEIDRRVAAAFVRFSSFVTLLFYVIRLFAGRRGD